jgi:phage/plasmid-associated DNA primase
MKTSRTYSVQDWLDSIFNLAELLSLTENELCELEQLNGDISLMAAWWRRRRARERDRCVVRADAVAPATPLYKQYQMWCDDAGEKPETQKMFGMRLRERGFVNDKIKRGPHKDRKGWFGIGLRADHPGPEDPQDDDDGPPGGLGAGDKGPLRGPSADDGPLGESRISKPNSSGEEGRSGQSGPKNQNPSKQNPRVEKVLEKRSASSARGDRPGDPTRFYRKDRGESEASEHQPDCLCEECLP